MAISLNITNLLDLFSSIAPFMLSFFLVMSSLFNQNVKGLVYLAGVLIASIINIFIMRTVGSPNIPGRSFTCNMLELPILMDYNSPAPNSLFIAFTIAYLVLPMKYNNQMNYVVLASLLCLFGIDAVTQVKKKCTTSAGSIFGALIGFVMGMAWFSIFHSAGYDSLLYFDELVSNNVTCSRPSKQSFKCSVYRGGELIASNIA